MFVYCFSSLKFAGFPNHLRVSTMLNLSVTLWTFRVSYKAATRDEDLGEIHYRMRYTDTVCWLELALVLTIFTRSFFNVLFIKISKFWQICGKKYYKWNKYTQYQFILVWGP